MQKSRQDFFYRYPLAIYKGLASRRTPAVQAQLDIALQGSWTWQAAVGFEFVDIKSSPILGYPDLVEKNLKYSYTVINSKSKEIKENVKRSFNGKKRERQKKYRVI